MNTITQRIERLLSKEYTADNFLSLARELFGTFQIVAPNNLRKEYSNFSSHIAANVHIGNYLTPDGRKIAVFSVQLINKAYVERARGVQRSYAKKLMESGSCDAALVAFFTPGNPAWRLSFVRLDYEMKFENSRMKAVENLTPAKRYSFLVGWNEPCHTAIERFSSLIAGSRSPTLDELEEAFSVERVTKEFFELYCEKYHQLREYLEVNEDFVEEAKRCGFTSEQFAKKLMGQVVFLYFLQKKGWLGVNVWPAQLTEKEYRSIYFIGGAPGRVIRNHLPLIYPLQQDGAYRLNVKALNGLPDNEEELIANNMPRPGKWGDGSRRFLRTLFEYVKTQGGHFFENYLEPLFYDTLNRNRGEKAYCPALHCRMPFLSGGLFEPLDGYDWKTNLFDIPDEIFSNKTGENDRYASGILDVFDRYNFTMSEDEPMEREVAIDPEMLGKVFENLLEVKDRKSKGAFYTPREIVHYMCRESLIHYLVRKTGLSEPDIRDFILYGDFMKDEDTEKEKRQGNGGMLISEDIFKIDSDGNEVVNHLKDIDNALALVRIADPAVGSGAFPLGMVNEIVKARENISAYMAIGLSPAEKRYFYKNDRSTYQLKLNAIKNSIFAVDIEPSAVDIAQLRLWLSLVIDDEVTPDAPNDLEGHRNPLPLPNLECNILCGNSLIDEFMGIKLINPSEILGSSQNRDQISLTQSIFDSVLQKFLSAQDELFSCDDTKRKNQIKHQIQALQDRLIVGQLEGSSPETIDAYNHAKRLVSKPFVLWELDFARVFRDNGGFDIVIGNPPYLGERGHKEVFHTINMTRFGKKFYQGKMDLFYFFFHKGFDILTSDGDLTFITTNYFPTAAGAKNLRTDIMNRAQIIALINFNETKVFESALGQHNMITMLTKVKDTPIECKSIICSDSDFSLNAFLHNMNKTNDSFSIHFINQTEIFDGPENYIRLKGLNSKTNSQLNGVLEKMSNQPFRLVDFTDVNQGAVSGCDYVSNRNINYVLPGEDVQYRDGIFVLDLSNSRDLNEYETFTIGRELIKNFFKNSDVSRYCCKQSTEKRIIYYPSGLDELKYPDIMQHLKKFEGILRKRLETYNENYNWTSLHRSRNERIFTSEKIVVPYRTRENSFAYNNVEWYSSADVYYITKRSMNIDLFYLLGLLNSKITFFWLYNRGKRKGELLELYQIPLTEIPIILMNEKSTQRISDLAKEITYLKQKDRNSDTLKLENEINTIIYKEYLLDDDEISVIEDTHLKIGTN